MVATKFILITTNNRNGICFFSQKQGRWKLFPKNSDVSLIPLKLVCPLIKELFLEKEIRNLPLAGKLKHFLSSWKKLASDLEILEIVEGYEIPLTESRSQEWLPTQLHMTKGQEDLVE